MGATRWQKSSYSGPQSNCVELAHTRDRIRDSKNHQVLTATREAVEQLVRAAKDNRI
ncbi:MAG: DUF397 domain-containing protein [Sciscionella sp.]